MYDDFQSNFTGTAETRGGVELRSASFQLDERIVGLRELFRMFGGMTFNNGVYRILRSDEVDRWVERIVESFPNFAHSIIPFGYDWLGRFFCIDIKRIENGQPLVLLFTHISDDVFNIPTNIVDFHNSILVEQQEAALEAPMFSLFLKANEMASLRRNECADLVVPLYLGGAFSVNNMKATDLEVSWDLAAQLLRQSRNLKESENIKGAVIKIPE